MRFIHSADLHFSNTFPYSSMNPETSLNKRFEQQIFAFEDMCDYALQHMIKYILIAGDIFHTNNPSSKVRAEIALRFAYFSKEITFITCAGNHDTCGQWYSLQDLAYMNTRGFYFHWKPTIHELEDGEIQMLPWGYKLSDISPFKKWKCPKVLLAHCEIRGAKMDNGYICENGFDKEELKKLGFDYIALGHFHTYQEVAPKIRYSGSMFPRDFKEMGKEKYFLDVNIEKEQKLSITKIKCCDDKFSIMNIEDLQDDVTNKIVRLIINHDYEGSIQEVVHSLYNTIFAISFYSAIK